MLGFEELYFIGLLVEVDVRDVVDAAVEYCQVSIVESITNSATVFSSMTFYEVSFHHQ